MMYLELVEFNSPQYHALVDLRYRVLREPLGLTFSKDDLRKEEQDTFIACYIQRNDKLVGCCILSYCTDITIMLRQMAVDPNYQHIGVGSKLLEFAEEIAIERGYRYIYLHARKVALDFYKKYGYSIESDEFIEVGIPHYDMLKLIDNN